MPQIIAIATTKNNRCGHFDNCPAYAIVTMDIDQKQIIKTISIACSEQTIDQRLQAVKAAGAELIIATQMDGPLQIICVKQGIPPLLNVQGLLPDIIKAFMENTLDYGNADHNHD